MKSSSTICHCHISRQHTLTRLAWSLATFSSLAILSSTTLRAASLIGSDSVANDFFGISTSTFGSTGLVGAARAQVGSNGVQGSAYFFRNLDSATGTVTQQVKLTAGDGASNDLFGWSVSSFDNTALVGAYQASNNTGAAYVFRGLDTATGTVTQSVKLIASDITANQEFGESVSLFGTMGLVGADRASASPALNQEGAAYLYRNLDTATGTVTQNAKLIASDGSISGRFGIAVSVSGNMGLIGATRAGPNSSGAVYLFRNLDTVTGTVTQDVKLSPSDGVINDNFGSCVSVFGNTSLIGAYNAKIGSNSSQGAAYFFRNLDTATGIVTEQVKLIASDGKAGDQFGTSVSVSGNTGLVGAFFAPVGSQPQQGAAYLFRNLDTASGTITQNVKLTASDGINFDLFGRSVSLSADLFTIGAVHQNNNTGRVYSGSVASVTTLDIGTTSKVISGLSFSSQDDWIIGQTTSSNQVTLSKGDAANVSASGKGIFIGKNTGANNNTLLVQGTVIASNVTIGTSGTTGNKLEIANNATTTAGTLASTSGVTLNPGSKLLLSGSNAVTDRIGNTTPLTFAGGTLETAGLSEGSVSGIGAAGVPTTGLGVLSLSASSVLDFGAGASVLTFADSHLANWGAATILNVYNWSGANSDTDRLFFGTDNTGLTTAQLSQIAIYSGSGTGYLGAATIGTHGEVEAVPEPSTLALLTPLAVSGLAGWRGRRRPPIISKDS